MGIKLSVKNETVLGLMCVDMKRWYYTAELAEASGYTYQAVYGILHKLMQLDLVIEKESTALGGQGSLLYKALPEAIDHLPRAQGALVAAAEASSPEDVRNSVLSMGGSVEDGLVYAAGVLKSELKFNSIATGIADAIGTLVNRMTAKQTAPAVAKHHLEIMDDDGSWRRLGSYTTVTDVENAIGEESGGEHDGLPYRVVVEETRYLEERSGSFGEG